MTIPRPLAYASFALPWIAVMFAFGWLCLLRFPPSGAFTVTTILDGKSAWINPFLPSERVTSPGRQPEGWIGQRILNDPTYFTARVPGPYDSVDVSLEYRPIHQTLLEFGIVRDAAGKSLDLQPLYASQLDSQEWVAAADGNVKGYVHTGIAASRLAQADPNGLEVWDASATMLVVSDPNQPMQHTSISLRGSHDFYAIPAGGALHLTFGIQAANRKPGFDVAAIRVFRGNQEIRSDAFGTNGSRDIRMDQVQSKEIFIPNAEPGVYRISFVADDDVFIRSIDTTSRHWVVGPRVYFGDVVGYATSTFPGRALTNSRHIVAETFHAEGLQQIQFGSVNGRVSHTHTATRMDVAYTDSRIVSLVAAKGDVRIIGDGFFALRDDAYFEPMPRRFSDWTDVERDNVKAVITPYVQPTKTEDGWLVSRFSFDLDPSLDQLRFVMSAPGVAARDGAVDIRRIRLTYHRRAVRLSDWLSIMHQEISNAWHRL